MKKNSSRVFVLIIAVVVVAVFSSCLTTIEAQVTCPPSGTLIGRRPPPGKCNTENNSECCVEGQPYKTHTCSPSGGRARLTLNSFEEGGDGGGASACDGQFHSDNARVVALSTGWFDNRSRCNKYIRINGNGQSVVAKVVDECDSTVGCDAEHDYQPPCHSNIVDASKAVWRALGVPENDWGNMVVSWSDA